MVVLLSNEERKVEAILRTISGQEKYSDEDVLRVVLREASRDQFGGWGRVWVSEVERLVGRKVEVAKVIEALRRMGYRVKYVDISGGIIYISS